MAAGSPRSSGTEPPRPVAAAPGGVPLVAGGLLPLAFVGFGLLGLVGGAAWLMLNPALLLLPHLHPHVVALAHVWLPGFLLSACIGAIYQLAPVVLGTPWRGAGGMWVHFLAHAGGVLLLVHGLAAGRFALAAAGGAFVSAGALLLVVAVLRTFAVSTRRDVPAWCFPLAAGGLAVTVLLGVGLAVLRRWPILPFSPLGLLRAHAHLGLAGFFLTLLQGATFQLVPMFTMGQARKMRAAGFGLAATQAGLLLLGFGLGLEWRVAGVAGAALLAAGITGTAVAFIATLQSRRRRQLEPGIQGFAFGAALLGIATLGGLALYLAPVGALTFASATSYGIVVIAGGLSLTVLGMLAKIIPFLVWMRTYGPRVGREAVPAAPSLPSRLMEQSWLTLHVAAVPVLAAAPLLDSPQLATAGAWLLAGGVAAYIGNTLQILSHTWQPQIGVLPGRIVSTSK